MVMKTNWGIRGGLAVGAFFLAALFVATNHFDRFQLPANESSAVGALRTLHSANIAYAKDHPEGGYPKKLSDLSRRPNQSGQQVEPRWSIDPVLATGVKTGYTFTYTPHSSTGDGKIDAYQVFAGPLEPGKYGRRHFFMNETGVIRVSETTPAKLNDRALR